MNDTLCRYLNLNNLDGPLHVHIRTFVIIYMYKCKRMSNTNAKPHFKFHESKIAKKIKILTL